MRMDDFDAYMKQHVGPVLPNEAYDEKIRQTLQSLPAKQKKPFHMKRTFAFVVQAAVIALVILMVLPSGQAILSTPWLRAYSSEDGQDYIVEGNALHPDLVSDADADDEELLRTKDYSEFLNVVGFDPGFPQKLPDGWEADSYTACWKAEGLSIRADYVKMDGEEGWLMLKIETLNDPEAKKERLQSDADEGYGSMEMVENLSVYAEYDEEWNQSVLWWVMDSCLLEVQGSVSVETAKDYAAMLTGAYRSLTDEEKAFFLPTGEITGHPEEMTTLDMEDAKAFIDGAFIVPQSVPDGFVGQEISCYRSDYSLQVLYIYTDAVNPEKQVQLSITQFKEIEGLAVYYEQNGPGKNIRYRGMDIYVSYNIDRIVCVYLKDRTFYMVTGLINLDEAKAFFDTLID